MGFFDGTADDARGAGRSTEQRAGASRLEPPEGWVLPTVLPWVRVLGQANDARIALVGLRCWPEGVSIDLHVLRRWAPPVRRPGLGFQPDTDDWTFRFGLKFSDGRRAIAPNRTTLVPPAIDQHEVLLRHRSGGGGAFHRRYDFYLWPLPPKGRLTLVTEWPAEKIAETHTELDAGEIRSAAARAIVVWPDLPPGYGNGGSHSQGTSFTTSSSSATVSSTAVTRRQATGRPDVGK
jgi:hypothetical protein